MRRMAMATVAALGCGLALAQGPDADALMAQVDRANRPAFERARLKMELLGEGAPLVREMTWLTHVDGANRRSSLIKFTAPSNLQGVGTLVVEEEGRPNAIWHYQPASRNVRRIAASHRQNRFMGTEFVFEDFEGLKRDKYRFEWLRDEPCRGSHTCHVIRAEATDAQERDTSTYGRKLFWVDPAISAIVKTEFQDRAGKAVKVFESSDFRAHGRGNQWRASRQLMRNLADGRSTRLTEVERQVDVPFDPALVSLQQLRTD